MRNCWLSEYYQTRLHMCHVSTRGALEAIQMAKLRGAPVTCEVTPHHLWFNNETCDYRVNPPIRTADDVQALIDGIRSGVVDAIATDHAPHSEEDKLKGMAGMVGSETAFGVCYTKLCREEGLPLELLVHLMKPQIPLLSEAGEQALQKKEAEKAARKLPELTDEAKHSVTVLRKAKEYLEEKPELP